MKAFKLLTAMVATLAFAAPLTSAAIPCGTQFGACWGGLCCSQFDECGAGPAYCGNGCQPGFGACWDFPGGSGGGSVKESTGGFKGSVALFINKSGRLELLRPMRLMSAIPSVSKSLTRRLS